MTQCFLPLFVTSDAKTADYSRNHTVNSRRRLATNIQIAVWSFAGRHPYRTGKFYLLFPFNDRIIDFNCFVAIVVAVDAEVKLCMVSFTCNGV